MVEETKEVKVKKEIFTPKTIVVKELPVVAVDTAKDNDGVEVKLMTIEDALTKILEKLTKIEKAVA